MIDSLTWLLALTFHKWILVFILCYGSAAIMLSKMIDRLGKETDAMVLARRRVIFRIIYLMFAIGTFAFLKDLGAFEALNNAVGA